jgi:hypothetical protein
MSWHKKLSRRELCELAIKMGVSSKILFPPLLGIISKEVMAQVNNAPKLLFITYGEGIGQDTGSKKSLFGANGQLLSGSNSLLTKGYSGLQGIEMQTSILEGVGGEHAKQYYNSNIHLNMKKKHLDNSNNESEHMITSLAPLNGGVFGQDSIDQFIKRYMNQIKIASFSATTMSNSLYGAISFCNSYKVTGCGGQGPGWDNQCTTYHTPITELNGLELVLGFGGSPPPSGGNRDELRKVWAENLLGVTDQIKSNVSAENQSLFEEYKQLLSTFRDGLNTGSGGGNPTSCQAPSVGGGSTNVHKGLDAAKMMMTAMACNTLDIGMLTFFPTAGDEPMFQGIEANSSQGVTNYTGVIDGLDQFMNSQIADHNFFSYMHTKGNHHFSHLKDQPGHRRDAEVCMDYVNSTIHRKVFQLSQQINTGSGPLSNNLITTTMYGMGRAHNHQMNNCPIIISSDGAFFQKNRVRVFSSTETFPLTDENNNPITIHQGRRWSEFLYGLAKHYLPNITSFADSRSSNLIDLNNL